MKNYLKWLSEQTVFYELILTLLISALLAIFKNFAYCIKNTQMQINILDILLMSDYNIWITIFDSILTTLIIYGFWILISNKSKLIYSKYIKWSTFYASSAFIAIIWYCLKSILKVDLTLTILDGIISFIFLIITIYYSTLMSKGETNEGKDNDDNKIA